MLGFVLQFFKITVSLSGVMLIALIFTIFTMVFTNKDVLERPRWVEHILTDRHILMSIMWTIIVAISATAEAFLPLQEDYVTRSNIDNPTKAAIATIIVAILLFVCACELIRVFLIPLQLRIMTTKALNEGKK